MNNLLPTTATAIIRSVLAKSNSFLGCAGPSFCAANRRRSLSTTPRSLSQYERHERVCSLDFPRSHSLTFALGQRSNLVKIKEMNFVPRFMVELFMELELANDLLEKLGGMRGKLTELERRIPKRSGGNSRGSSEQIVHLDSVARNNKVLSILVLENAESGRLSLFISRVFYEFEQPHRPAENDVRPLAKAAHGQFVKIIGFPVGATANFCAALSATIEEGERRRRRRRSPRKTDDSRQKDQREPEKAPTSREKFSHENRRRTQNEKPLFRGESAPPHENPRVYR